MYRILIFLLPLLVNTFVIPNFIYKKHKHIISIKVNNNINSDNNDNFNFDDEIISIYDNKLKKYINYNFSNQTTHFIEYFINNNSGTPGYFYF